MAVLIHPKRWGLTKPPPGSSVAMGHPLARGMVFAQSGIAGAPADVGYITSSSTNSNFGPTATPNGVGLAYLGSNGAILTRQMDAVADKLYLADGYTIATVFSTTKQGSGPNLFSQVNRFNFYTDWGNSRVIAQWFNDAGIIDTKASASGQIQARTLTVAVQRASWGRSYGDLSVNGIIGQTMTMSGTHVNTSTAGIRTGGQDTVGAYTVQLAQYAWARFLLIDELRWLTAEPFAFYVPPEPLVRRVTFPSAVTISGAGAIVAAAATSAGTGTETIAGAAVLLGGAVLLSGAGTESIGGTAGLTGGAGSLAGAGSESIGGTAGLTGAAGTVEAVGTETIAGAGTVAATPATITGEGTETIAGTLALIGLSGLLAGAGTETIAGLGALLAAAGLLSGAGSQTLGTPGLVTLVAAGPSATLVAAGPSATLEASGPGVALEVVT